MEEQKEEIVGFLHNVSSTKKGSKTSYFDMSVQTADGLIRGVCFSTSKQEHFDEMSNKESPIKPRNFRLEKAGDATTVLMSNNVLLEPTEKNYIFTNPSANNIQSISVANINQMVTIKAKLVQMSAKNKVKTQDGEKIRVYAYLVDPHEAIKVTLWEEFSELKDGTTNNFQTFE